MATVTTEEDASTLGAQDMVEGGALNLREATAFSGLPRSNLYALMTSGKLPYTKVGKRRLIPRNALKQILAAGLVGAR